LRYRNYIASHAWRSSPVRLAELAGSRGRCRICAARASRGWRLEVHHSNYRRLGRELRGDLIALCSACHRDVESFLRRRRYARRRPVRNDVVPLRDLRYRLFDPTR
jgi:5-methylcytosine-specific restriction endonuclease McrA